MTQVTGTRRTRTEHSEAAGVLSIAVAVGIPALLALFGLIAYGFAAISWASAIVWGAFAALVMAGVVALGRRMGMTRMHLGEMLGSMFAERNTSASRTTGMGIHLINGSLLAVAWAYTMTLFGWATTWFSGMVWGLFISLLALLLFSSIGLIHPKIRAGEQDDPGPAASNFGRYTPAGVVMAHLVYGLVLGMLYQLVPLS